MKTFFGTLLILLGLKLAIAGVELTSARLYYNQGEWAKSLQFFDQAIEKEPDAVEAYWERGRLLGEIAIDSSRADLAKSLTNDSANPATELLTRMVADFQRALKPQTPEAEKSVKKFRKKLEQFQQERWNEFYFASVGIDTVVTESDLTDNPDASKAKLMEAVELAGMAIMIVPERWNAYGQKAQLYERLGDIAEADAAWRAAQIAIENSQKKDENYEDVLGVVRQHLLANGYELGHLKETVKLADEILAKDAENLDAVQYKAFSLAKLASDTGQSAEARKKYKADAVKALDAARAARADDPIVIYYMGQFNLELGDTAAAITAFGDYLKMDAGDVDVLFALGVLYLEGGSFADNTKATEIFKQLTDTNPDFQPGWQNYGVALIRGGKTTEAKKALEKSKALQGK